ncbi:MAG: hypothetical protein JWM43_3082 [Acidobacteriaceae bacterium]|nr:hypothetical protein [Acidobacteriaceae bacterium]
MKVKKYGISLGFMAKLRSGGVKKYTTESPLQTTANQPTLDRPNHVLRITATEKMNQKGLPNECSSERGQQRERYEDDHGAIAVDERQ